MPLDAATLMLVSGLVTVVCGVSFVVNTAYLRSDGPGRIWSVAYIAAVMSAVSYNLHMHGPDGWWPMVVGHVTIVIAVGALWSGLRLDNRRSSLLWVVLLVAGFVLAATLLHGPGEREWTAAAELPASVALLSGLGCAEAARGALRRNLNGRILACAFGAVAIFGLVRTVLFVVANDLVVASFGEGVTALLNMSFVIAATIAVSVLRAEQGGRSAVGDQTTGIHSAAGVLSPSAFAQAGTDHLDRACKRGVGLALIGAEIDNLPAINAAFGRRAGDDAINEFARTLRFALPVMSLIGHRDSGRFVVLARATSPSEALVLTGRIRTAMVQNPLSRLSSIRLTASFGIADSFDHGHDFEALCAAADAALGTVQKSGGNDALVAPAPVVPAPE
ncbi:hypothetical protein GY21_04420 [Cryobacterium roopkundense]|uniref:Diguanylate cyclase (GGDEF)-like protein n=1 Tax=Cryobacterium roopkundense TaxID=1001240 RepID=A0A099JNE6_9MICO|nr:diguanylate cyclase [Cryobacterium roopkundense]KGJ79676.1 hypothetical protein GY21_04420 [Cryobacterium roopkundense]MBB5642519.1 diguanylate cyclase (GGDEF)-like protein [Cryobacterium roopkundense]